MLQQILDIQQVSSGGTDAPVSVMGTPRDSKKRRKAFETKYSGIQGFVFQRISVQHFDQRAVAEDT